MRREKYKYKFGKFHQNQAVLGKTDRKIASMS